LSAPFIASENDLAALFQKLATPEADARDSVSTSASTRAPSESPSDDELEKKPEAPQATGRLGRFCRRNQEDMMTTVMIRNIPCKYTQEWLIEEISSGFTDQFNFFYMPVARKSPGCLGYAFINFVNEEDASQFLVAFENYAFPKQPNSTKRATVAYAALQGFTKNVKFYDRSKIGKSKFRPYINRQLA
jgi:RNA recognition motif-containing protein